MSSGNYSITTRATGTLVTAAIYNADHQNHVTNQNPLGTGAYSDNQTQMQLSTSPGTVGGESFATSLGGELERLRYIINQIVGGTQWYDLAAFPTMLSQVTTTITTAKAIYSTTNTKLNFVMVAGDDGSGNQFIDLLFCGFGSSPSAPFASYNGGAPAIRTYAQSGANLTLAMASGIYSTSTFGFALKSR